MSSHVAKCGLGHQWEANAKLVDYTPPWKQGKRRPKLSKQWQVLPERCPTCGHPWTLLQPKESQ